MNKFETRQLIVDNWFRKEKPLGPGKKGTFEKQTQMTKELKEDGMNQAVAAGKQVGKEIAALKSGL